MNKKIKNKKPSSSERHIGVILEDLDSKLDLVVEGHQALDKKIDNNHQEFKEFQKEVDYKFDLVLEGHQALDKKIVEGYQVLDKKIEKVDKKVDDLHGEMNYKFGVVFDELHLIRNELKEKVGRDEFVALEKRVIFLEKKLSSK